MTKNSRLLLVFAVCSGLLSPAAHAFPFQGEIDLRQMQAVVSVYSRAGQHCALRIRKGQDHRFILSADIQNISTELFDITTSLESSLEVIPSPVDGKNVIIGKLGSRYTLVDHKPVEEFFGQFVIKDGIFYLDSLTVGKLKCRGNIRMSAPYLLAFNMQFFEMDIDSFLTGQDFFGPGMGLGMVDGEVSVDGEPGRLLLKGKLASNPSGLSPSDYQRALINFSGIYPEIDINNSNVTSPDGMTFNLVGRLNLRDRKNFAKQIDALRKEPLVSKTESGMEWTLKRLESQNRSSSTEVKYLMRNKIDSPGAGAEPSGLLGVEQKIKF